MSAEQSPSPASLIVGRLLIDPAAAPELGWVLVRDGEIAEIGFGDPPADAAPPALGGRDRLISPTFMDAHAHLPQFDSVGCDGLGLLEWLDRVVFPAESWWGRGAAMPGARAAVRRMLTQGTSAAAVYLTSHAQPASEVMNWLASGTRMKWIAGRIAMDRHAPDDLCAEDRARARLRPPPSIALPRPGIAGAGGPVSDDCCRVSVNPRFAIACSDELLAEAGWYVRDHPGTWVQTHLAETDAECALVRKLFPESASYAEVYDRHGLLGEQTLLAHGIHLSDDERRLIAARDSILVHCPAANLFLQSGFFDLDAAEAAGVRVALGSDIAAGPDVAMPRVARAMIETAKIRAMTGSGRPVRIPSPSEAWSRITRGNADLLGWPRTGRIEVGASADLLVLRPPPTWFDEHLIGRLIYGWSSSLIEARVLEGCVVDPTRPGERHRGPRG